MNTQKRSNNIFLAITTVLAVGVLTGCQYCEPMLMATLVIALIKKSLTYSPFAESTGEEPTLTNQKI
jgi:hypothetical protein